MIDNQRYCFLHTMDGIDRPAIASQIDGMVNGHTVARVQCIDNDLSIYVTVSMYNHKFESEDCPVFYNC